ncbi:hypothetical protein GF377_03240 [candidate division GN15 bacterium]|nr:hypothetical protein [candidate division GN15 bacterium]
MKQTDIQIVSRLTGFVAVLACAVLLTASAGFAQQADQASLREVSSPSGIGVKPSLSPSSLLDASRISWSHSYSVSFFSGGNTSGSVGLLRTTMFYDISDNLKLSVNLGMTHNPGALWGDKHNHNAQFLPGFQLDWRPSEKVFMSISVQTYNGWTSPYNYYRGYHGSRYYSSPGVWSLD